MEPKLRYRHVGKSFWTCVDVDITRRKNLEQMSSLLHDLLDCLHSIYILQSWGRTLCFVIAEEVHQVRKLSCRTEEVRVRAGFHHAI